MFRFGTKQFTTVATLDRSTTRYSHS